MRMKKSLLALLAELEKTSKTFWNISRETAEFLHVLAGGIHAKNILEIGTSNGYSGVFLASACQKLYTVESHKERFELAAENFKKACLSRRIRQIKGHAPEILKTLRAKFDLVFLDATKYEYTSYLDAVWSKIAAGGFLVADNVDSHKDSLREFFEELRKKKDAKLFYAPVGTGLLVIRKL